MIYYFFSNLKCTHNLYTLITFSFISTYLFINKWVIFLYLILLNLMAGNSVVECWFVIPKAAGSIPVQLNQNLFNFIINYFYIFLIQ
jgi:hypothetical protein